MTSKLGEHFSLHSVLQLFPRCLAGGAFSGLQTTEYGFCFCLYGYASPPLPLPGVRKLTPIFELVGEKTGLKQGRVRQETVFLGCIGFRADLKSIGDLHPSLGLGYVFSD